MSIRLLQTVGITLGFALVVAVLSAGRIAATARADEAGAAKLRHVVLFKFKPEVTKEQVSEVVAAFGALPKRIDAIKGFEWGTDVSVEMKAEGFTHCFVVTFADAKGRDAYLPHAAHAQFVKLVGPRIEKVLVFDFVQGK
jgi:hypothetical protein